MSSTSSRKERGRSSSPYGVVSTAVYESGPPASKMKLAEDDPDVMEVVKEEEWEERRKKTTTKTKNIERRVQRQLVLEDGQIVNDTGAVISEDTTEDTVVKEDISNENARPEGQLELEPPPDEGWVATPGAVIISEKSTKTTKSHDEVEDELETEEVQHCGDVTNQEAEDHIRGKNDLRELIRQRETQGLAVIQPRKRIVLEATRKKGHIDTTDVNESSKIQDGHVITETSRTVRQEQYDNESIPDSGSSMSDGSVHEAKKETSHNIVHIKDEDLLEYYAVPKGGTLAQGVKIGEGMHVVSEDVQENRQGNDEKDGEVEQLKKTRKPSTRRDALTKKLLNFDQEEHTRKRETNKWLEHHFGSESGRSEDSNHDLDESANRKEKSGGNRITITMSPYPASKEETHRPITSSTQRNWASESTQKPFVPKASSLTSPTAKTGHFWNNSSVDYQKSISSQSPSKQVYDIQDTEIANARSRLRSTGVKLVNDDKENNEPYFESTKDIPFRNHAVSSTPKNHRWSSINNEDSFKNDVITSSRFRSGAPMRTVSSLNKEKYGNSNIVSSTCRNYTSSYASPSLANIGRSQSFHVQTLPLTSKNHSTKSYSKLSNKDFRSEEKLNEIHDNKRLYKSSNYQDENNYSNNYSPRRERSYQTEDKFDGSYTRERLQTRELTPPRRVGQRNYIEKEHSFSSNSGRETGTQTGIFPVPPPRTKRKKRPKSSYFFGQDSGDLPSRTYSNSQDSYRNRHSYYDQSPRISNHGRESVETQHILSRHSPKTKNDELSYPHGRNRSSNYQADTVDRARNYSYSDNKDSWTNTVDPRRKPRLSSEEERPITLPRKVSSKVSNYSSPSKTYIYGDSKTSLQKPHLENGYSSRDNGRNVHHIPVNKPESNSNGYRSYPVKINDFKSTTKPVGRSQSFNLEANRRRPFSNGIGRTLADISGQKSSTAYGSSPYVNLTSPNLIATIARTSSTRIPNNNNNSQTNGIDVKHDVKSKEKKDRFMKGLLDNAPELYNFIHGSETENQNGRRSVHDQNTSKKHSKETSHDQLKYSLPESLKSPVYTAPVFTFGKGDNDMTATSNFSKKSNDEEQRKNHYNTITISTENGSSPYSNLDQHNRKTDFNLKTSGSSLLYSPSFRSDRENSLERRYRRKHTYNDAPKTGDFKHSNLSSGLENQGPVSIQVRDWNMR